MKLPATLERVIQNTPKETNERIHSRTQYSLEYHQQHPEHIERRLEQLDEEWDIERALAANASSLTLAGSLLGLATSRKFFILPLAASGFLLQHALKGWCAPMRFFRQHGYRTSTEIEAERYALQSMSRGEKPDIRSQQIAGYGQQTTRAETGAPARQ